MKECMWLSANFGAHFSCWRTRWKACFSGLVGAGPTWTTVLRWPQEQRVVERIEPAIEVTRSFQRVIFAIFSVATSARNDCSKGLNLNFKKPGIVSLSACKSDHLFITTLTRAARTPGKQWLKTPAGRHINLRGLLHDFESVARLAKLRWRPDWATALRTGRIV